MVLSLFAFLPLWATLAVGAAAVAVPVVIHLLSRLRYRVVTWAAMRFLLAAQQQNTRRLRLEHLILLLVRTAILAALVLAMASVTGWAEGLWQTIAPGGAGFGGGRSGRTHLILVLDGSLSMGTTGTDGKTCFEKARAKAAKLIGDMQSGDAVSILLMKESPVWIVGEASQDARKALKELKTLRLPHGNSSVPAMLGALAAKLREGGDRFDSREIYFLTDLQQTTWIPEVAGGPPTPAGLPANADKGDTQARLLEEIQKRARTIFVDVGRDNVDNAAVTLLALSDPLVTTNSTVTFLAQVKNFGAQTKEKLNIRLNVGRWQAGDKEPALRPAAAELRNLRPGEEQAVNFTHKFTAPGTYAVQVAIDKDDLSLDDTRTVIVTVKDTVPVLLVNGKASVDAFERATEYLAISLNPFGQQANSALTPFRPKVVSVAQFADANQTNLADYDCVFFCDVGQLSTVEVRRLEANVRRGAGLVITVGDNVAKHIESYNRLLWKNERGLLPAKLLGTELAPPEHYFTLHATDGFAQPPLKAFIDQDDQVALQAARFQQYLRSQIVNDATVRKLLSFTPDALPGSAVKIDRALPVDEPALIEWNPPVQTDEAPKPKTLKDKGPGGVRGVWRFRGKVILLTSTANMDWNSWPASPSYLAMMHELTRFAVGGRLREQAVLVGTPLEEFFLGSGELDGVLRIDGEDITRKIKTHSGEDLSVFRWPDTDQSGIYRLTIGQDPQEYLFAVNVPTAVPDRRGSESDLARADKAKLKAAYPGWDLQVVKELGEVQRGGQATVELDSEEARQPKPIGPWIAHILLLVLVLLLFVELILAACFGHYSATAGALSQAGAKLRGVPALLGTGLVVVALVTFVFLAVALIEYSFSGDFLGFCLPEGVRAWVEDLLDVPPPAPGESTRWTLSAGPVLHGSILYPLLAVGVIGLAGVVVLLTSLFEARSGVRILVMVSLAVIALVNIVVASTWLLLQPEIHFERQSWPDVVLLIDDSMSMNGVDPYRDEEAKKPVTRLAERWQKYVMSRYPEQITALKTQLEARKKALANDNRAVDKDEDVTRLGRRIASLEAQLAAVKATGWRPTRLQLAQSIMLGSDPDWLATLSKKNRLKIHIFHLDATGRALKLADASGAATDIVDPQDLDRAQKTIASMQPYGTDSRLGTAVRQVIDHYRGAQLCGIIMLTDGVTTTTKDDSLGQVSEYAAQKGVPLFFVGIGEDQATREIELHDLQVGDPVFVNDKLIFEVRLTGTGYKDLTIPVVLKVQEGKNEKELAREEVKLDPSGKAVKVRLKYQPTEPGEKLFIVEAVVPKKILDELPPGVGERRLAHSIEVQENKLIRVLYIEGSARYEYRYLKNLLERQSSDKKVAKSIDLKVLLLDSDDDYPSGDKTALAAFPPNQQELFQYDVIILGDADPRSRKLGEPRLRDLADFVKVRGHGLLLIAGPQYMPHAYKDSELAKVMPIDIGKAPVEPEERTEGFRLEPTLAGRLHPILRFVPDETENLAIWQKLAPIYWWSEGYRPKPLAEVLAVHPRLKVEGKAGTKQDDRLPLIVQQYLGGARSMFFGFDESWRWRFREDELRFNQFWIQTVRYLARSKQTRTELRLDRQSKYKIGEPIKVTVRFPDTTAVQDGKPDQRPGSDTKVIVTVEHRAKGADDKVETEIQTLQLAKVEGSWATYEGTLTRTREGEYRFWLSNPDVSKENPKRPKPSATATVVRPPGEDILRFNQREMIQAAAASRSEEERKALEAGGRKDPGYYTVATADQVLEDLSLDTVAATGQLVPYSPRPPWPVWNLFLFSFLPVVMLISGGWLLRKAVNLL